MPAIQESRLKNGTLKLGPVGTTQMDFSCQITNARITTSYSDDGDSVTVLCGQTKPAPRHMDGHTLDGTLIQDFDIEESAGGVVDYLWNHDLDVVAYEYVPNDGATCPVVTGTLQIEIPGETFGGDVNARITSDFSFNLQETPLRTYPGTLPPTITGIAPASIVIDTDTPCVITGTDFKANSEVLVDGVVYPTGTYVSDTEMTFTARAPAAGTQDIVVRTGTQESPAFQLTVTDV
jgi:hypothetical protein